MSRRTLLSVLLFLLLAPPPQATGGGLDDSKIALHLSARSAKSGTQCDAWDVPCSQFATSGLTRTVYDAYLVVANGDENAGISGLSCGVAYDEVPAWGVDVFSWNFCGALEFPSDDWPDDATGTRLTWNSPADCQTRVIPGNEGEGVHAVAGSFYLYAYSAGAFSITRHPRLANIQELAVTSCDGRRADLSETSAGSVHFTDRGTNRGWNPCTQSGDVPPELPPSPPPPPPSPGPSPSPSHSQEASFMLHVAEVMDPRTVCDSAPRYVTQIVTQGEASSEGAPYYVYVLGTPRVMGENNYGLAGLRFGIDYHGGPPDAPSLKIFNWTTCGEGQSPLADWPEPGSGNTLLWGCETGQVVVGGFFYVAAYAPAVMSLAPSSQASRVLYAPCGGGEKEYVPVHPSHVGWVSMGGGRIGNDTDGCNPAVEPCADTTPVLRTTWGGLKAKYEN